MSNKPTNDPVPAKPAAADEKRAAEKTGDEGLQPGRENTNTRKEVLQHKTPQGQPNRG
jgi:hypothetical protein